MSLSWLGISPTFYITTGNNVAELLPRSEKDLLCQTTQDSALFELLAYTNMPITLFDLLLAPSSGPAASLPPADGFSHRLLLCTALFCLGSYRGTEFLVMKAVLIRWRCYKSLLLIWWGGRTLSILYTGLKIGKFGNRLVTQFYGVVSREVAAVYQIL